MIWRTLGNATLYYCQRDPGALARFQWVVDAKSEGVPTQWEDWWSLVVRPALQARSFREPFLQLAQGDYSHFPAKEMPISDYHADVLSKPKGTMGVDLRPLLKDITFSSDAAPGLEVVDVLTNAVRRALTGRLDVRGWGGIAGVMIHRGEPTYIHMISLGGNDRVATDSEAMVLQEFGKGGRNMLTD